MSLKIIPLPAGMPMISVLDNQLVIFAGSLVAQWLAGYAGHVFRSGRRSLSEDEQQDFSIVENATLTLLALIIGFTFSMAVTRYDQRKITEAAEANAIGTEYARVDFLPPEDAKAVRELLGRYVELRILFYVTRRAEGIERIDAETSKLEAQLWTAVATRVQPTPLGALTAAGMNDVLNAQAFTYAAWRNRIPVGAWVMMWLIAVFANGLIGYGGRRSGAFLLLILPAIISVAFLLISDINSPRGGFIRVHPHNLIALAQSIKAQ
jgi:hypothetical protein